MGASFFEDLVCAFIGKPKRSRGPSKKDTPSCEPRSNPRRLLVWRREICPAGGSGGILPSPRGRGGRIPRFQARNHPFRCKPSFSHSIPWQGSLCFPRWWFYTSVAGNSPRAFFPLGQFEGVRFASRSPMGRGMRDSIKRL